LGAGLGVVVAHLRESSVAVDEGDGLGGVVEADDGCGVLGRMRNCCRDDASRVSMK
jgi:hypothetical protein